MKRCSKEAPNFLPLRVPRFRHVVAPLFALAVCGCASRANHGESSVEFLEPIAAPQATTTKKADDIVVIEIPPSIEGDLAVPAYPPAALAAHAGLCVVYATVTLAPDGTVTDVAPSWQRVNVPNAFSEAFLDAVVEAARKWRFEPARYVYWKKNGDADLIYLRAEVVPAMVDVKFTFEASGKVR